MGRHYCVFCGDLCGGDVGCDVCGFAAGGGCREDIMCSDCLRKAPPCAVCSGATCPQCAAGSAAITGKCCRRVLCGAGAVATTQADLLKLYGVSRSACVFARAPGGAPARAGCGHATCQFCADEECATCARNAQQQYDSDSARALLADVQIGASLRAAVAAWLEKHGCAARPVAAAAAAATVDSGGSSSSSSSSSAQSPAAAGGGGADLDGSGAGAKRARQGQ